MNIRQPLIKICGLQDVDLARDTVRAGAAFVGLILYDKSRRAVSAEVAARIAAAVREAGAEPVPVFVDATVDQIMALRQQIGFDYVQLHGSISRQAHPKLPPDLHRIYTLHVAPNGQITNWDSLPILPNPTRHELKPDRDYLLFDGVNGGSGQTINLNPVAPYNGLPIIVAGGLNADNISRVIRHTQPHGVDVSSGVENGNGHKDPGAIRTFIKAVRAANAKPNLSHPDARGRFGRFGGQYIPELLLAPVRELTAAFNEIRRDAQFTDHFHDLLQNYVGRPTPLTETKRLRQTIGGPRIFLKREDLLHTGAHKINNALGQCLLAKYQGKTRIIAETGAGQHGVATATAAAHLGLESIVYMGRVDMERQAPNVARMQLLGTQVVPVETGSRTLKDAVNEAMRDWAASFETTHYCLGSALGPHPFPAMVAYFQSSIGRETRQQFAARVGGLPDQIVACVGGGSNAIGIFSAFLDEPVELIGVEAGGFGDGLGNHAARFHEGTPGVLHGCLSYVLQDYYGQIAGTHSISAGLDYPSVGPQHAWLHDIGRVHYTHIPDDAALHALKLLSATEGIIPALESAHALAYVIQNAEKMNPETNVVINLSGRGDKDLPQIISQYDITPKENTL